MTAARRCSQVSAAARRRPWAAPLVATNLQPTCVALATRLPPRSARCAALVPALPQPRFACLPACLHPCPGGIHPCDLLLLMACTEGDDGKVAELLEAGADPNVKVGTDPACLPA